MKTRPELLELIEQRCLDASWDYRPFVFLYGLSQVTELSEAMTEQAAALGRVVVKAELFGQLRSALVHLTKPENAHPAPGEVGAVIGELKRLEGEISEEEIDYVAILRQSLK